MIFMDVAGTMETIVGERLAGFKTVIKWKMPCESCIFFERNSVFLQKRAAFGGRII
jgi:hypothetical protein